MLCVIQSSFLTVKTGKERGNKGDKKGVMGRVKHIFQICKNNLVRFPTIPKAALANQNSVASLSQDNQTESRSSMMPTRQYISRDQEHCSALHIWRDLP